MNVENIDVEKIHEARALVAQFDYTGAMLAADAAGLDVTRLWVDFFANKKRRREGRIKYAAFAEQQELIILQLTRLLNSKKVKALAPVQAGAGYTEQAVRID